MLSTTSSSTAEGTFLMEFQGKGGSAVVDGDHITLTRKGLGTGLLGWQVARRIPIAAIREVMWQPAGSVSRVGYIHFVLGDAPTPKKTGFIAMSGLPETVDFNGKKESRSFEALHAFILDRIEEHRAAGVDPATIPFLSVEENAKLAAQREVAEQQEKVYAGKIVTRDNLDGTVPSNVAMVQKLKEHPELVKLHSLDAVSAWVDEGEPICVLAFGDAVVALTDRRVLVLKDELGGSRHDEMLLTEISSVSWDSRVLHSGVTFQGPGRQMRVKGLSQGMAQEFIDGVARLRPAPEPATSPTSDPMVQLRELAALRDSGIITEEEFAAKKADLLDRI